MYRDDEEAALARADALEDDLERTKRELEETKVKLAEAERERARLATAPEKAAPVVKHEAPKIVRPKAAPTSRKVVTRRAPRPRPVDDSQGRFFGKVTTVLVCVILFAICYAAMRACGWDHGSRRYGGELSAPGH